MWMEAIGRLKPTVRVEQAQAEITTISSRRRVREIGMRMALGARTSDVLRMILAEGMTPTATGMGVGLAGALALGAVDPGVWTTTFGSPHARGSLTAFGGHGRPRELDPRLSRDQSRAYQSPPGRIAGQCLTDNGGGWPPGEKRRGKKKVLEKGPEAVNATAQDYSLSKRQAVTKVDRPSE